MDPNLPIHESHKDPSDLAQEAMQINTAYFRMMPGNLGVADSYVPPEILIRPVITVHPSFSAKGLY